MKRRTLLQQMAALPLLGILPKLANAGPQPQLQPEIHGISYAQRNFAFRKKWTQSFQEYWNTHTLPTWAGNIRFASPADDTPVWLRGWRTLVKAAFLEARACVPPERADFPIGYTRVAKPNSEVISSYAYEYNIHEQSEAELGVLVSDCLVSQIMDLAHHFYRLPQLKQLGYRGPVVSWIRDFSDKLSHHVWIHTYPTISEDSACTASP